MTTFDADGGSVYSFMYSSDVSSVNTSKCTWRRLRKGARWSVNDEGEARVCVARPY